MSVDTVETWLSTGVKAERVGGRASEGVMRLAAVSTSLEL